MGLTDNRQCVPVSGQPTVSRLEIQGSVGKGGKNIPPDVVTIQQALNRVPAHEGGPLPPLVVDGLVGPKTVGAIYRFQQHHFGVAKADGRVDPGHRTPSPNCRSFSHRIRPGPQRFREPRQGCD
jgi:peptidoglycan hydrolase-like protein with peptidoglycan-binding domain